MKVCSLDGRFVILENVSNEEWLCAGCYPSTAISYIPARCRFESAYTLCRLYPT